MLGPEFASCWLKIARAEEHVNLVKTELRTWVESKPYVVSRKRNADGSRHSIFVEITNQTAAGRLVRRYR
jgi:hypothetical protein